MSRHSYANSRDESEFDIVRQGVVGENKALAERRHWDKVRKDALRNDNARQYASAHIQLGTSYNDIENKDLFERGIVEGMEVEERRIKKPTRFVDLKKPVWNKAQRDYWGRMDRSNKRRD
jgi:hypothetical protein